MNLKDKLSQMIAVAKEFEERSSTYRAKYITGAQMGEPSKEETQELDRAAAAYHVSVNSPATFIALVESLILAVEALSGISISDELWDLARVDGVPDDFMVRAISAKDLRKIREAIAEIEEKMK